MRSINERFAIIIDRDCANDDLKIFLENVSYQNFHVEVYLTSPETAFEIKNILQAIESDYINQIILLTNVPESLYLLDVTNKNEIVPVERVWYTVEQNAAKILKKKHRATKIVEIELNYNITMEKVNNLINITNW